MMIIIIGLLFMAIMMIIGLVFMAIMMILMMMFDIKIVVIMIVIWHVLSSCRMLSVFLVRFSKLLQSVKKVL